MARILFVDRDGAKNLSAGLRLHEISRSNVDAGTEIPIVRESALLTASAHLQQTPGSRYWALVSITNNDTQRVTLVTPP